MDSKSSKRDSSDEPGTQHKLASSAMPSRTNLLAAQANQKTPELPEDGSHDDGPFMSDPEEFEDDDRKTDVQAHDSLYADVRGVHMLKTSEFYELFVVIGMMTGIGLMTIKYVRCNMHQDTTDISIAI